MEGEILSYFILTEKELISLILVILIFLLIYFYIEFNVRLKINSYLQNIKEIVEKNNTKNLDLEKNKEYLKKFKQQFRKLIIILIFGILFNKIHSKIYILKEVFDYPIISHDLIELKVINLLNSFLIFLFFRYLISSSIYFFYSTYTKEKIEELSLDDMIKYIGNIVMVISILGVLGINFTLLIPIAGALGIGAGFALQDLLKNVIAGLIILLGKIVKKGDYIKFENFEGYVKEVNLRTTIIRTPSNEEVIVPNSMITENPLVNYSLTEPIVRIDVPFGVSYKSDIKKVFEIAKKVGDKYSEGESQVIFREFGSSALEFTLRIWINIRRILPIRIKSKIYTELFEEFRKNNIEIPFNQLDVWFKNELKIKNEKE